MPVVVCEDGTRYRFDADPDQRIELTKGGKVKFTTKLPSPAVRIEDTDE